ncbi:Peptidyl-prolyl cis-trans isomerase-like 1 [Salinomyces thailandicus]|uniref:Peptidyl-prolyl cis-trans isomerase n=1 Tax=Salinomyces thailandicus TaxID=706561 RepID=A0A4U0U222_9PEZI|nr:Peptidyl-prolyl cis-trans isomerase-like 1 [Salinomyces thailandica]
MDKLKKLFKHDKEGKEGASSTTSQAPPSETKSSSQPAPRQSNAAPSQGGASSSESAEGVVLHTNVGDITIALYRDQTPKTCQNFSQLASTGKYDNVVFHRIIKGFMIQGGDPTGTGRGGESIWGGKFEDEIVPSLKHEDKGTMSMANAGPGTNGSQFFITLGPTPHLNGKHTVFGHVVQGMEVVDKLGSVRTGAQDRPVEEVKIVNCDTF